MKAVIQRVSQASVSVDGNVIGQIGYGYLVLLGVADGDTEKERQLLVRKITEMRICQDENGKTNLSLQDIGGEMLVINDYTDTELYLLYYGYYADGSGSSTTKNFTVDSQTVTYEGGNSYTAYYRDPFGNVYRSIPQVNLLLFPLPFSTDLDFPHP